MPLAGQVELLKGLVGLDECIDHLQRGGRIDIIVQLAVDKQQRIAEQVGVIYIGATAIRFINGIVKIF